MKLFELLRGISYSTNVADMEITGLTGDSRQLEQGFVFVCMRGLRFDGHSHAGEALDVGAAVVIGEHDMGLQQQVIVENSYEAYSLMCANYFGNPAAAMKLIGITGTNGKTTSAFLIKQILTINDAKVGLLGTVRNEIGELILPSKYTTADPYQLQAMLARMAKAGCEYVVMEVSSHALAQSRVHGLHFACALFTNLTQDHLDYHHTMEEYFLAKRKLFDMCDCAVVNMDDSYGQRILQEITCRGLSFSLSNDGAQYTAKNIKSSIKGSTFALLSGDSLERVSISSPGDFSIYNALGAAACCTELGLPIRQVTTALSKCGGVPGRFEVIPTELDFTVVRDYAHTTDGIEKVLKSVKDVNPKRIVTLFGCAGCRDASKRPAMGETAAKYSDFLIVTSDNPREEDPMAIIDGAMEGILGTKKPYKIFVDRYEAIDWALKNCEEGDLLLLLGKGHEDYQVLDYGSVYFNEKEIVQKLAAKITAAGKNK